MTRTKRHRRNTVIPPVRASVESTNVISNWVKRWRSIGLPAQFMTTAGIMLAFFAFLDEMVQTRTIQNSLRASSAESASLYINDIIGPIIENSISQGEPYAETRAKLDKAIADTGLNKILERIKIWRIDGTIIYSTIPDLIGRKFQIDELPKASRGNIVVAVSDPTREQDRLGAPAQIPMLEVHVPIRDDYGRVVAVGEIHKDNSSIETRLSQLVSGMWLIRSLSLLLGIGTLYLLVWRAQSIIEGQKNQLDRHVSDAMQLARQNDKLRIAADESRRRAVEANEDLLNRVGAEIHDGPIQILTAAMLGIGIPPEPSRESTQSPHSKSGNTSGRLVAGVIDQLREISTGLLLPELEELAPNDVIMLAVAQHERATGLRVETDIEELPQVSLGMKACMFRIVQECLNNAHRYADGKGTRVEAHHHNHRITLQISDQGPGLSPSRDDRPRLGLLGARNRVEAFGGAIGLKTAGERGLLVEVQLPLEHEDERTGTLGAQG